jgi:hypothetical protein
MALTSHKITANIKIIFLLFTLTTSFYMSLLPINCLAQSPVDFTISSNSFLSGSKAELPARSRFIIRNSLLGVIEIFVKEISTLERKTFLDSNQYEAGKIKLGTGTTNLRRGLRRNANRSVITSISLKSFDSTPQYSQKRSYLRFRFTRARYKGRIFELTYYFDKKQAVLRQISARALTGKICPKSYPLTTENLAPKDTSAIRRAASSSTLKTFTVATDCDYDCYQRLGQSSANDRIAEFFNSASSYYKNDFDYDLKITSQTVRTSTATYSATLTDSSKLLDRFTVVAKSLPNADLKHLITAKNIDSNIVGLSYLGVVCSNPEYSYGFSQHLNDLLSPIVIAHEIGHNFNADHDPRSGSQGIMTEVLSSPYPTGFSSRSKAEITSHIDTLGANACYDLGRNSGSDTSPTLPSVTLDLKLKFSRSKFVATSTINTGNNCSIELHNSTKSSGLLSATSLLASANLAGSSTSKFTASNIKKVLVKDKNKKAKVYFRVKASCTEGVNYSDIKSLDVGVLKSSKFSKKNTVSNTRKWLQQLSSG